MMSSSSDSSSSSAAHASVYNPLNQVSIAVVFASADVNTRLPVAKDVLLVNADFLPLVDPTDVHFNIYTLI